MPFIVIFTFMALAVAAIWINHIPPSHYSQADIDKQLELIEDIKHMRWHNPTSYLFEDMEKNAYEKLGFMRTRLK